MNEVIPVQSDCPQCPACKDPCAVPLDIGAMARINDLRCTSCGHEWEELELVRVVHAWWSAGAWEAERRRNGDAPMTFADIAKRSI